MARHVRVENLIGQAMLIGETESQLLTAWLSSVIVAMAFGRGCEEMVMVSQGKRSLRQLQAGDSACVATIANHRAGAKRLADLGFVDGASITMVRSGKPCIVRIDDRFVGLGLGHQEVILLSTTGGR